MKYKKQANDASAFPWFGRWRVAFAAAALSALAACGGGGETVGEVHAVPVAHKAAAMTTLDASPSDLATKVGIASAAVSASAHDGNLPANTVDANMATRWAANGDGQWIQYDLGASKTVAFVKIAWNSGDTRKQTFDLLTSVDGAHWSTVLAGKQSSGSTAGLETYDFADTVGRYVRIVGHGNTSSSWNSIRETEVYEAPPPPVAKVSLTAAAVSASANDGNLPSNTVDANLVTRWAAHGDGQWIQYDLGASKTVAFVKIAWNSGDTRKETFDLLVSSDGANWNTVLAGKQSSGSTAGFETYDFADTVGRYVRIVGHGNTSNSWNSIWETEVYEVATKVNLTAAAVSASANDGNLPANTVDANMATRWAAHGDGQWIQYDLGASKTVAFVKIAWNNGDTRKETFDVLVSADGANWSTVLAGKQSSGSTVGFETYDFADTVGRYVRIVGHGNTSSSWNSIWETEVYEVSGPVATSYTLTGTTSGSGTITRSPNQTSYAPGTVLTLTASPAAGYVFTGWGGAASGTVNPLAVTMNGNKSISATFAAQPVNSYTLSVSTTGSGAVSKSPSQTSYAPGTVVSLSAAAAAGYSFAGWSGDASGSANPLQVTMGTSKNISATFTANPVSTYALSVSTFGSGSVSKSPNLSSYAPGAVANLTATAAPGYSFAGWGGDASGSANPLQLTMGGNKNITATFTAIPVNTYTLAVTSSGSGSVTKSPNQASYAAGTVVTLSATPAAGYAFSGWGGAASGASQTTTVIMNGNQTASATFTQAGGAIPSLLKSLFEVEGPNPYVGTSAMVFEALTAQVTTPNGNGWRHELKLIKDYRQGMSKNYEFFKADIKVDLSTGGKMIAVQYHAEDTGTIVKVYVSDSDESGFINSKAKDGIFDVYVRMLPVSGPEEKMALGTITSGGTFTLAVTNNYGNVTVSAFGKSKNLTVSDGGASYLKFGNYLQSQDPVGGAKCTPFADCYQKFGITQAKVTMTNVAYERK